MGRLGAAAAFALVASAMLAGCAAPGGGAAREVPILGFSAVYQRGDATSHVNLTWTATAPFANGTVGPAYLLTRESFGARHMTHLDRDLRVVSHEVDCITRHGECARQEGVHWVSAGQPNSWGLGVLNLIQEGALFDGSAPHRPDVPHDVERAGDLTRIMLAGLDEFDLNARPRYAGEVFVRDDGAPYLVNQWRLATFEWGQELPPAWPMWPPLMPAPRDDDAPFRDWELDHFGWGMTHQEIIETVKASEPIQADGFGDGCLLSYMFPRGSWIAEGFVAGIPLPRQSGAHGTIQIADDRGQTRSYTFEIDRRIEQAPSFTVSRDSEPPILPGIPCGLLARSPQPAWGLCDALRRVQALTGADEYRMMWFAPLREPFLTGKAPEEGWWSFMFLYARGQGGEGGGEVVLNPVDGHLVSWIDHTGARPWTQGWANLPRQDTDPWMFEEMCEAVA